MGSAEAHSSGPVPSGLFIGSRGATLRGHSNSREIFSGRRFDRYLASAQTQRSPNAGAFACPVVPSALEF